MTVDINWTDLSRTGYKALSQGNFAKAEKVFRSVIDQGCFEEQDLRLAYSFLALAGCLFQQENWHGAIPMYQKAQKIYENVHGLYHQDVATSLLGQARCLSRCGRQEKCIPLFKQALNIYESIELDDEDNIACTIEELANCYMLQRNFQEALPLYERVILIFSTVHGPCDDNVGNALFSAARCCEELNEDKKAILFFSRALEVYKQANQPSESKITSCHYHLARSYHTLKDYLKAEGLYLKALAYFQTTNGMENNAAHCTFALAVCYMVSGDYRAEEYFKRAKAIYDRVIGPEHTQTASLLEAYAKLLGNTCRAEEAKWMEEKARQIRKKSKD